MRDAFSTTLTILIYMLCTGLVLFVGMVIFLFLRGFWKGISHRRCVLVQLDRDHLFTRANIYSKEFTDAEVLSFVETVTATNYASRGNPEEN